VVPHAASTTPAATAPTTASGIVQGQKTVFYRTEDDSAAANWERRLRCGCCNPSYVMTAEAVKIESWEGCSRKNTSIDIDEVEDMALKQGLTPGYCFCGRGHIVLYLKTHKTYTVVHVEKAEKVFKEFSSSVAKVNNLKFGINRADDKETPFVMYDSALDNNWVKFCRSVVLCGGCCFFPHTVITKERITTIRWTPKCQRETLSFDLDRITDVKLSRTLVDCCLCSGNGTIMITGTDADQTGVKIPHLSDSKAVFSKLDNFANMLNNRNRVVGEKTMAR
jgi:hypothetical protein